MLKIKIVEGLSGILKKPIKPAVIINGIKLGKIEIKIIRIKIKSNTIITVIKKIARSMLYIKFLKR